MGVEVAHRACFDLRPPLLVFEVPTRCAGALSTRYPLLATRY